MLGMFEPLKNPCIHAWSGKRVTTLSLGVLLPSSILTALKFMLRYLRFLIFTNYRTVKNQSKLSKNKANIKTYIPREEM